MSRIGSLIGRLWGTTAPTDTGRGVVPQASDGGILITSSADLEEALRGGAVSSSGQTVTPNSSLGVSAVYACVRIISGAVATMPLQIKRRRADNVREDASDTSLWNLIRRKPNRWQKPAQFKRMMQTNVLLRGNAFAHIVRNARGEPIELIPLNSDRVEVKQRADLSIEYIFTRKDGVKVTFKQNEVMHLFGLTLDGITGVSVIRYARETIGLSLAMEEHGANVFKNGARLSGTLSTDKTLGQEGLDFLRSSLEEYRQGGAREGKDLILEDGLKYDRAAMSSNDAQWIEARKLSRTDIFMFFGLPPHMAGDTEKSTSWGTGIEEQTNGFVTYTLEDHLTMWEEGITGDLTPDDSDLYALFNRAALVRGNLKARKEYYQAALQWGWLNPDEVRALEDMNPREGGKEFYEPPNTAGGVDKSQENSNEPQ
jgi:HK97 family phage portal protein